MRLPLSTQIFTGKKTYRQRVIYGSLEVVNLKCREEKRVNSNSGPPPKVEKCATDTDFSH